MPRLVFDLFPGGLRKALTLSYDDGVPHDRRFVDILNLHGLKGTFHLNAATLGTTPGRLEPVEVAGLFMGHEVSAHSATHPHLETLPGDGLAREILEDRRALETLVGYPVRGMSYPYGSYDDEVVRRLPALGIEYARTTQAHGKFHLPTDPLRWHPTCHHRDMLGKADEFLALQSRRPALLYVWGHSFEFERDDNWELMEEFAAKMAPHAGTVWFATNINIFDYMQALRAVRTSVDGSLVHNGSHRTVWMSVDGETREIAPGGPVCVG